MATTETKVKKVSTKVGISTKAVRTKVAKAPKASKVSLKGEKSVSSAHTGRTPAKDARVILRIRVRAYESKILDASVKQIIDTAVRHDAVIVGPVPLPTEIKKYTVNRSPFIYKNTREQFEIRVHKRLIDIINPNAKTIEALTNLSLPSGVDIDVKMM